MVEVEPGWELFTGEPFERYRDGGWLDSVHADDRQRAVAEWRVAVESRSVYATDVPLPSGTGGLAKFVLVATAV